MIDWVLAAQYGFTEAEVDFIPSTKLRAGPSMKLRALTATSSTGWDATPRKNRTESWIPPIFLPRSFHIFRADRDPISAAYERE
jgi:hypothetical protein